MTSTIALSLAFSDVRAYHMTSDSTKFGGEGVIKYVYYILITHIVFNSYHSDGFVTYVRALAANFESHKKISRITFLSGCVAVTGVIVYLMISPYYVY
jgi:putative membrane protein